ncbi:dipeptide ABC transporter ATP-binding protein [Nocardia sp. SYP-A9097]|uniref:dipeptide ABC transporter ATP-binding protein n=1 Tax=Nocardia sp. SYP-A9097 TaxID=2663237 RepID=UPI00129B8652|nr:ABC transporter ATP-binding protein [Nocardia sp. SYP-A9097]MRH91245.1 dipeptide ABC transporter ATP-binding protein [Nocardia sp. SYP-A9097]
MTRATTAERERTGTPIVEIDSLAVGYLQSGIVEPAVHSVTLAVRPGEIVALVGESGSGKSTTAHAVIGLLPDSARITGGSIRVGGVDLVGARERLVRSLRGSTIGLIPQDPMLGLNPTQRIGAQVAEAVRLRGLRGAAADAEVLDLLRQAGLDDPEQRLHRYPHELSGGQRQRVLIAIALAGRPELIIADEPTSALDVTVQARILDHLESLVRESGIALLIITHDLAIAADRADRVAVMRHGRIVESGTPTEILVDSENAYTRRLIAVAPALAHEGAVRPRFQLSAQEALEGEPILELDSVTKQFRAPRGSRGQRVTALDNVSVRVAAGRTHAVVGESGSGKTTMLRIAMGLETPTSGSVRFDGSDIAGLSWRRLRPLRRRFQLVHQNPFSSLDPRFTVRDSIIEPLVSFGIGSRAERHARAAELLDQVALPRTALNRLPGELSGGQRQRVAIARALSLQPDLVLLDEPVSALDVSVQAQILQLLLDLQQRLGLAYLFVSHDLAVVAQIAHTVSVFDKGTVVESGSVADVFGNPAHLSTQRLIAAIPGRRALSGHPPSDLTERDIP